MKGRYPTDYFTNPFMDKERSIEQIWDDIDAYTGEYFEDEPERHSGINVMIPIPPMYYNGKFVKGFLFSQGMEFLLKLYPDIPYLFNICPYTMWSNYSWCEQADCYFTCYENKEREKYYKNKYPNKKDIIFIPLQDADYCNEYAMVPVTYMPKTIDVLMVASPIKVKNFPIAAEALKIYEKKYNYRLKATFVLGNNCCKKRDDGSLDYSEADTGVKDVLNEIDSILYNKMSEYINFEPYVDYYSDLPKIYSSAKCTILTSLIEGKNRSIFESISCNTPVVVFKDHNKWARGGYPVFFGNSGEYVPEFSPESLADTIHKVITHPEDYEPRKNHLMHSGRKNLVNTIAEYMPYYQENIPGYEKGRFYDNIWVDLACQDNHQLSFHDFLYTKRPSIAYVKGLESIDKLMQYYFNRYEIE